MIYVLWILVALLIVIGLAGTVLPALPGAALVFGGILLGAWIDGFQRVGVTLVVVCGLLIHPSEVKEEFRHPVAILKESKKPA
jgi:uncharacterized protein YqgC (DUF456 family)